MPLILAAVHDLILFGPGASTALWMVSLPLLLLWAWHARRILGGPTVWHYPGGLELRTPHATQQIASADVITLWHWGPRILRVARLEWRDADGRRRRFYFEAGSFPLRLDSPFEPRLCLANEPSPSDVGDPHGTRKLLIHLMPAGERYLDASGPGLTFGSLFFRFSIYTATMFALQAGLRRASEGDSWALLGLACAALPLSTAIVQQLFQRMGPACVEPTSSSLVLNDGIVWSKRRFIAWPDVREVRVDGDGVVITFGRRFDQIVQRRLAPAVLAAARAPA